MTGFTEVLVYATWAAAPVVAYQSLMDGMAAEGRNCLTVFGLYSAAVLVTCLGMRAGISRLGVGVMSPIGVLVPWGGTGMLSGALYLLGRKTDGSGK